MLTQKDLQLFKYDASINRLLSYTPMPALRKTISLWFDVPELYPRNRTSKLEHYTSGTKYKNKVDILQRIKAVDWVIYMTIHPLYLSKTNCVR